MFIAIDKKLKVSFSSKSKKEIAKKLKLKYNTVKYYYLKEYYENSDYIFSRSEYLKSGQGGKSHFQDKLNYQN